jgi:hypothetical protein
MKCKTLNLIEPPWYGPVCQVVWEGKPVRATLSLYVLEADRLATLSALTEVYGNFIVISVIYLKILQRVILVNLFKTVNY